MLPFVRPLIPPPEAWAKQLHATYRDRQFTNFGPANRALCALFEDRMGAPGRKAITFANATVGLTAALLALRPSAKRVICPSFTIPATVQAILAAGLEPVFCDVDEQSWELSPAALEHALARTASVAAVLHVRSFGFCHSLTAISDVCARKGLALVVDAAAAMGGRLGDGSPVGHEGMIEVFSLHATKPFGIGEGGMGFCPDDMVADLTSATNFGIASGGQVNGTNAKMSEFHAAIGLAVAEEFAAQLRHRTAVADRYRAELKHLPVQFPDVGIGHPPWQTLPLKLPAGMDCDLVEKRMHSAGVVVRRYYAPALHRLAVFSDYVAGPLPVTEALAEAMICLPIYADMTSTEQDDIMQAFSTVLADLGHG